MDFETSRMKRISRSEDFSRVYSHESVGNVKIQKIIHIMMPRIPQIDERRSDGTEELRIRLFKNLNPTLSRQKYHHKRSVGIKSKSNNGY
jgi:hypothetical protein